jgi:transmembrane sensor
MTRNLTSPPSDLLSEAAHWYNERLAGDMTPADEIAFNDWVGRSPAHSKAYRTVDRAWVVADAMNQNFERTEQLVELSHKPKWFWRGGLAASLLLGLTLSQGWWTLPTQSDEVELVQDFKTTTGQRSVITLPDGTRVTMDSETEVKFTDLETERRVEMLRGRAYFDVAKNAERPFIVHVSGKTVKALGTMFEVSMTGDVVAVVLTEGRVRVDDDKRNGSAELTPGRQLVMRADKHWTLRNVDLKKETSWTEGRLIFSSDPLPQAVEEVNRYSTRKIVFEGGQIPSRDIVGIFSAGDVDGFVRALELNGIAHKTASSLDEVVMQAVAAAE